ncbi:hypothetical protein, partial [Megasphaera elsdenii]|uniref:hypothetical protein n=1 Tax=Megasphaera elsdenii TaxID=907 RepID=UPI003D04523B
MNGEKRYYDDAINEFKHSPSACIMLKQAFKELVPQRNGQGKWDGIWILVIDIILSIFFAIRISFFMDTLSVFAEIIDKMIDIEIAIFGCVFTVYTILLAFFSDDFMKRLAEIKVNQKESYLQGAINYFGSVLFLWFLNISITAFGYFFTKSFDKSWCLVDDITINNIMSTGLLFLFFSFSFRVFFELKSTIYSLIILFRS